MKDFIQAVKTYAQNDSHIKCALIVGSYARKTNKEDSDLDLIIITTNKQVMVKNPNFINTFGKVNKHQNEYYGACTSIRVWYEDGKEVEFGLVEPSWLALPLDQGTKQVLSDGYQIIIDKDEVFADLLKKLR